MPAIQRSIGILILLGWRRGNARPLPTAHHRHRPVLPERAHIHLFIRCVPTSNLHTVSRAPKSHNVCPLRSCADDSSKRYYFHRLLWAIPPMVTYIEVGKSEGEIVKRAHITERAAGWMKVMLPRTPLFTHNRRSF